MNILYPSLVMIGLTLFCLFRLGFLRTKALQAGEVSLRYFSLYQGDEEPEKLRVHSRHLTNLLEMPVLFYVVSMIAYVAGAASTAAVVLAWGFVALRLWHSYIHLTSNTVALRFRVFAASALVLLSLWLMTVVSLLLK